MAFDDALHGYNLSPWYASEPRSAPWTPTALGSNRFSPRSRSYQLVDEGQMFCSPRESTRLAGCSWTPGPLRIHYPLDEPASPQKVLQQEAKCYTTFQGYPSPPYYASTPSIDTNSLASDRQSPTVASPDMGMMPYSPQSVQPECFFDQGVFSHPPGFAMHGGGFAESGVAMHNVQRYADAQPVEASYDEEDYNFGLQRAQEGFVPMQPEHGDLGQPCVHAVHMASAPIVDQASHSDDCSPVIRKRRVPAQRTSTAIVSQAPTRVTKRSTTRRSISHSTVKTETVEAPTIQPFPCPLAPYGCKSSFPAKNEWKRHALTQHFRMGFWRCDRCAQSSKKPNDFNRKDLFVQHLRRMHPFPDASAPSTNKKSRGKTPRDETVEEALNKAAEDCYRRLREPPLESCCCFCDERFIGKGSFDQRMEHIGRHMEEAKKSGKQLMACSEWQVDEQMQAWMLAQGLVVRVGREVLLADGSC